MIYALCFGSTFLAVFALGLQSLNVNQGQYIAAALTSALISTGHVALYKFMPTAGGPELVAYYAGGILGITSSMWFHRVVRAWWNDTSAPRAELIAAAIAWPGAFWRACMLDLERWYDAELERINHPDPQPRCTRCCSKKVAACWRVDCPFHGTDVH